MLRGAALSSSIVIIACSSSGTAPCTLTAIGAPCTLDTDCCSGYCELYEDQTTACQAKPASPQACVDANGYCTQNRNCCSGLCQDNACFGSSGGTSCLALGSSCIQDDSCCSNNCANDGEGNTACTPQPQPDGGTCGVAGAPCTTPGDDPSECCFGVCTSESTCAGSTSGGGGGNCGGAGTFCRYGSDCCSGQCEETTSGNGSCH